MRDTTVIVSRDYKRRHGPQRRDLTGQRFGRLVVLSFFGTGKYRNALWNVRCDCGTEKVVQAGALNSGATKSCGCWARVAYLESRKTVANENLRTGTKRCGNKQCSQSNPQPLENFSSDRKRLDGKAGRCKTCEQSDKLRRAFGISLKQKQAMIAAQGGKCANNGCVRSLLDDHKPSVDHNHATGVVRAILCGNCNTALGLLSENPERILGLIRYLEKHIASQ